MKLLTSIRSIGARLAHRSRAEGEMDEEVRAHIESRAEDLVRAGMPRADAEQKARIEFGGPGRYKEEIREAAGTHFVETLIQDVRYGLRMLRKSPGFTAVAVITLALGIGVNTAIFSYVDAWLIKPLPFPEADRLMCLNTHDTKRGWTSNSVASTADFVDFQKETKSFQQTAAFAQWAFNLTGDGPPALLDGGRVSWAFFDTLGVKPLLGRTFREEEDLPGGGHVAILAEGLWKGRYGSDPNIIGHSIRISDESYTVVGVMPGTFQFTLLGISNLWTPMAMTEKERANRNNSWFWAFGRLKPGVTMAQASAESTAIFAGLEKLYPKTNSNITQLVSPMVDEVGKNEGTPQVMICLLIVGLILLIACANVANLMLARAARRTKEFAVRRAIGATGGRLVRQLLSESLVLFFLGAIAGTLFGAWGMNWIQNAIPGHVRGYLVNYGRVELDFITLSYTLGIALVCGIVFGLAPAVESARLDLSRPLKESSGQASGTKHGTRLRRIFVGGQIALAVVVLISTALLVRSFLISVRTSPGYNPSNLLVAQLSLPKTRYTGEARQRNFTENVLPRLRGLPQVVSVGAASAVPFGGFGQTVAIEAVDKPAPPPGEILGARFTEVSADYFTAMQIGVVKGRGIAATDVTGQPLVTVVSETLAKRVWPNEDPIGKQLRFGEQHTVCTIVGVARDIKMYNLRGRPERQMYVALEQFPSPNLGFVVRTSGNPWGLASAVRDQIWAVDADQPVSAVEPLEMQMAISDAGNRVLTKLMVFFGLLAMFLGALGVYGLMSQLVAQRTQEIGIRMALGASPLGVMRMVVGQGLKLAIIGVVVGVAAAFGVTRSLTSMLYIVTPSDPATFAGVSILFAIVATAATYLPARRAMRVDPIRALRYE